MTGRGKWYRKNTKKGGIINISDEDARALKWRNGETLKVKVASGGTELLIRQEDKK